MVIMIFYCRTDVVLTHRTHLFLTESINIYCYDDGVYQVSLKSDLNKAEAVDKNGNNVVPCRYDNVQLNRIGYPYGMYLLYVKVISTAAVLLSEEMIPCNYYKIIITDII